MKILEIKVLRGPNYWSITRHQLIQMLLDIEELEDSPTNKIPGFYDRLKNLLPSLYEHKCSEGVHGGFFKRVEDGTWMGHVVEHIAIAIQNLAGMAVEFGQTREINKRGVYHVVFSYTGEKSGKYAAKAAVQIAEALIKGEEYDVQKDIDQLKNIWNSEKLGPSTASIVAEAKKRGIPVLRLDENSLVQLGYGCKQKKIEATISANTGSIAVDIACNKDLTKKLLAEAYIPVPNGEIISSVEQFEEAINSVGFPIVVKPLDGNHGNGATVNINDRDEAVFAFERANSFSKKIIVEKFIEGQDFRILVINNKFVAAALRTPASISGDGTSTIKELIEQVNKNPQRGNGHENILTAIKVDEICSELMTKRGYTLDTVLPEGEIFYCRSTANLSTGGTATDVTDEVHSSNILLFERVARTVGLDICGIDVIANDLSTSIKENGGAVIEVNAAPGFRMHLQPTHGKPRNVAKPVVDMLFKNDDGRIPVVAITGTNGKTTTTRLLACMAQKENYITGYTTTDGIYINNELITTGDCSGPSSAKFVLKDSTVQFAVLETARGGLLRSGLGFDKCSTAIITNVAEDHLGLGGIDTLEKLARVKCIVAETVVDDGYAILNADDDLVYGMRYNVDCKVALFSLYAESARIEKHCAKGGLAAYCENGYIIIRKGNQIIPVEEIKNIPLTFGGKAEFNIANVLGATLAAYTNKIKLNNIRKALRSFMPSSETTPGRLNIFEFTDFTVLLDYAHNPHGVKALGKFIKSFDVFLKIGVIAGVGDRRDEDITAIGEEAAKIFDEIIIRHDDDLRGRTPEELNDLLKKGIEKIDASKPVKFFPNECEAVEYAITNAQPKSIVVVLIDKIKKVTELIQQHQKQDEGRVMDMKEAV